MNRIKKLLASVTESMGYFVGKAPPPTDQLGFHLSMLFDKLDINCVLDIGAHHGEYARFLRQLGYGGRIISWEPIPESFRELSKHSEVDPNWMAYNFALGESDDEVEMNVTETTMFASFLSPNQCAREHFGAKVSVARAELVRIVPLDKVFEGCVAGIAEPRIYAKLDTQGYDLNVLKGARESSDRILGLQTEVSVQQIYADMPNYLESIAFLNSIGFALSGLFPVNIDRDLRLIEMDCLMVRGGLQSSPES